MYHNLFGPYPFLKEKYGHTQFAWGGGEEHQTNSFVKDPGESLCAHELAHQWFGDKITCAAFTDIWLNEGFATHSASMFMESRHPESTLTTRRSEITNITSNPGGSVFVDDTTSVSRIFDFRLTYLKRVSFAVCCACKWVTPLSGAEYSNT
ncbi:MAG: M1 family aminopeptidase [Chitinophagaceae bacterium]